MMFTGFVYSVDGIKPGENFQLQLGGGRGGQ
jgi:hypothetical protein